MSTNLALNKPASASSYVSPFSSQRAVDGNTAPVQRWVCAVIPGWMEVDLGNTYGLERWVVRHMGASGWSANYNMKNYKLQGSLDNANWFDMDTVTNNSNNVTDRGIPLILARYLRVYVTAGLNINQGVASIAEFEAYGTQSLLSDLVLKAGRATLPLIPQFNSAVFSYSAGVGNGTPNVNVIPTALDSNAVITVNGEVVISGQSSQIIYFNGQNSVTIQIKVTVDDDARTYVITVNQ